MKKNLIILLVATLLISCQNVKVDPAPMSGTINESDEKTAIIVKLAKAYEAGTFEEAREYFTSDGKHYFNSTVYTTDQIIEGYNFHSVLYDNLEHVDPTVTTMYYNNGEIYTNQWADWSGTSKITGEVSENTFHCFWKWQEDKIVETRCYIDPTDLMKEIALYQAQTTEANKNYSFLFFFMNASLINFRGVFF